MVSSSKQQLAEQLALQLGFEQGFSTIAEKQLKSIADDAARIYENSPAGSGLLAVSYSLALVEMRFEKMLKAEWPAIIRAFSGRNFSMLAGGAKHERKDVPQYKSDFSLLADQWMEENGTEEAKGIADTTRRDIIDVIVKGQQEGLGTAAIAKLIRDKVGEEISRYRAETIAITETHNAASFANYESARLMNDDLELGLKKRWLSTEDARTRPTHRAVNNQVRGMDETFTVGGAAMMRPGDQAGGAKNVIRCRCVLGWVTGEE